MNSIRARTQKREELLDLLEGIIADLEANEQALLQLRWRLAGLARRREADDRAGAA